MGVGRGLGSVGQSPTFRKVTSKEMASIGLAIVGEPESAKDKPRMVFETIEGEPSEWYRRIFMADNTAAQWLLPVEIHRQANAFLASLDDESPEFRIGKYGRYRLLWLAFAYLRQCYGGDEGKFLSATTSEKLLATCDVWAPHVLEMANDALVAAYDVAKTADSTTGLREFFREPGHRVSCEKALDVTQKQWLKLASKNKQKLPEFLELPGLA